MEHPKSEQRSGKTQDVQSSVEELRAAIRGQIERQKVHANSINGLRGRIRVLGQLFFGATLPNSSEVGAGARPSHTDDPLGDAVNAVNGQLDELFAKTLGSSYIIPEDASYSRRELSISDAEREDASNASAPAVTSMPALVGDGVETAEDDQFYGDDYGEEPAAGEATAGSSTSGAANKRVSPLANYRTSITGRGNAGAAAALNTRKGRSAANTKKRKRSADGQGQGLDAMSLGTQSSEVSAASHPFLSFLASASASTAAPPSVSTGKTQAQQPARSVQPAQRQSASAAQQEVASLPVVSSPSAASADSKLVLLLSGRRPAGAAGGRAQGEHSPTDRGSATVGGQTPQKRSRAESSKTGPVQTVGVGVGLGLAVDDDDDDVIIVPTPDEK